MNFMMKIHKAVARIFVIIFVAGCLSFFVPQEVKADEPKQYKVLVWEIEYNASSYVPTILSEYSGINSTLTNGKVDSVSVIKKDGYGYLTDSDLSDVQLVHIFEWHNDTSHNWNATDFNSTVKALKNYINRGGRVILHGENAEFGAHGNKHLTELANAIGGDFRITTINSGSSTAVLNTGSTEQRIQNLISGLSAGSITPGYIAHIESTNTSAIWVLKTSDAQSNWVVDQKIGNGYLTAISDINAFSYSSSQMQRLLWNLLDNSADRMEEVENHSRTVTFDKNTTDTSATNPSPASIKVVALTGRYGELATCTRTAYTLDGWYTQATGGDKVLPETDVTNDADHTLYAHWTPENYTITYNLVGGTNPTGTVTSYTIESTDKLPTPTQAGKSFTGWKVNTSAGSWTAETVLPGGTSLNGKYGNLSLTAQWIDHTHDYEYTSAENTITATCLNTDNKHQGPLATTFSIIAPEKQQYGDGKDAEATLDGVDDFNIATGKIVSTADITYVGRGDTNYPEGSTAPTDVGTYTAKITVEGVTASIDYEIAKAELKITAVPQSKVYGDSDPALTYTSEGLLSGDSITGDLSRDAGENVGSYAIKQGTVTAGDNYTVVYTGANLTITAAQMTVNATGYSGTYDGASHGIIVTSDEATMYYSEDGGVTYSTINPQYMNVGEYTVNYKVERDNYETVTGSQKVEISKRDLTVKADSNEKEYDGDPLTVDTYTFTAGTSIADYDSVADITITGSQTEVGSSDNVPSNILINNCYGVDATGNYNIEYENGTLLILKASMNAVQVSIGDWTYGEDPSQPSVTADFGEDTVVYTYSDELDGTYTDEVPTDAGDWYVKADIPGTDNYPAGQDVVIFTITPADSTPAKVEANERIYDGEEEALITVDESTLNGGKMLYTYAKEASTVPSDSDYTETIPTATEVGTYYVWYMVKGDDNHNDTEPLCVSVNVSSPEYYNSSGDGTIWKKGSGVPAEFIFKRSVKDELTYGRFTGVMTDGQANTSDQYESESGSAIVRLMPEYLETLELGAHTLTATFEDGDSVTVNFTIVPADEIPSGSKTDKKNENIEVTKQTSDDTSILIPILMMLDSAAAAVYILVIKRKLGLR